MGSLARFQQEEHLERIRQVLARDPRASVRTIAASLGTKEHPIELDIHYVQSCLKKIRGEWKHRTWGPATERLAQMEDFTRLVQQALWNMVKKSSTGEKPQLGVAVTALSKIGEFEYDLLKAQMDLGVFDRKLGTLATQHGVDEDTIKRLAVYVAAGLRYHYLSGGGEDALRAPDQLVAGVPADQE